MGDPADVLADLESLLGAPSLVMLGPGPRHLDHLLAVSDEGDVRGIRAHDAHVAVLAAEHGVQEIWTLDRGFRGLGPVRAVDPFADPDHLREPRRRYRVREPARP